MIHSLKLAKLRLDRRRALIRCIGPLGYLLQRVKVASRQGRTLASGRPFTWRPATSDVEVIRDVLIERQYRAAHPQLNVRTIIDAGANIGLTCLYFKEQFPDARIIALEPDADNFELLCKNTANLDGITCLREALWHRDEPVEIINRSAEPWAFRVNRATTAGASTVPGTCVTTLLQRFNLSRIDYLKIDIEGAERDVFGGNTDWLDSVGLIAIELHDCISVGCARNFYRATGDQKWTEQQRGEVVFMLNSSD